VFRSTTFPPTGLVGRAPCKRAARVCLTPSKSQLAGLRICRQRLSNKLLRETWRDIWQKPRIVYDRV